MSAAWKATANVPPCTNFGLAGVAEVSVTESMVTIGVPGATVNDFEPDVAPVALTVTDWAPAFVNVAGTENEPPAGVTATPFTWVHTPATLVGAMPPIRAAQSLVPSAMLTLVPVNEGDDVTLTWVAVPAVADDGAVTVNAGGTTTALTTIVAAGPDSLKPDGLGSDTGNVSVCAVAGVVRPNATEIDSPARRAFALVFAATVSTFWQPAACFSHSSNRAVHPAAPAPLTEGGPNLVGPFGTVSLNDSSAVSGFDVFDSLKPAEIAVLAGALAPTEPFTLDTTVYVGGGGGGGFGSVTAAVTVAAVRLRAPTTAPTTARADRLIRTTPDRFIVSPSP